MALKSRWSNTCSSFGIKQDAVDAYWDKVQSMYTEKQRRYHTLSHITDMFRHFDDVKDHLRRQELVAMAIFFHDIVYEPKERDNEEKSAELFQEFAKNFDPQSDDTKTDTTTVYDWIIDTKKHETEVHKTPGMFGQDDLHYFLDMDMAILGCADEEYRKYADDIRVEYQHVPEQLFRERRAMVLRTFLKVPNIYATEIFRTKFESRARENIASEISRLEG